ncbi:adapter protein MecA 1/2 [Butyrivibrio fibrisolvens DSM 3071]|jgi:adapter protein MecA 1/2|uniref:Adapter protein MecA 1/2 n=1 Tax=Butyrivibrio fibrisolvens DSM 3071 TaxID=1121131 RepID=A0A1M5YSU5_BUTFI|nr:adaptor protein MecA [Butyrivibrio fibrisolvens]SHI15177.1 adapter protein MecA 1/2 [Butyrivibrio fibrisolvens DSM 3071]
MKFNRVDDTRVECIISEEDLEEYGIGLQDLLTKKKEAMDFLREIIEKAEEEVDYKPMEGTCMPMQVTVTPDNRISITLSEDPDGTIQDLLEKLTHDAGIQFPKNFLEELGDAPEQERIERINQYLQHIHEVETEKHDIIKNTYPGKHNAGNGLNKKNNSERLSQIRDSKRKRKSFALDRLESTGFVFSFTNMADIIRFAHMVTGRIKMQTSLYKNPKDDLYYLHFEKGTDSVAHFASVFTTAYEFGNFVTSSPIYIANVEESYEAIIKTKAVDTLRSFSA